jgi:hypothetical protein
MARFTVNMTLEANLTLKPPARRGPVRSGTIGRLRAGGAVRYLAGDGVVAVTAVVRADTAAEAARQVARLVEQDQVHHGLGPVRVVSWTAVRSVPVLAGLGRRRSERYGSTIRGWDEGWDEDDGDDGDGTAGVREPRRPRPSPGAMSAEIDVPREVWGRFPA